MEGGEGSEEEGEEENVEDAQELLDGLRESMEQNAGKRRPGLVNIGFCFVFFLVKVYFLLLKAQK